MKVHAKLSLKIKNICSKINFLIKIFANIKIVT